MVAQLAALENAATGIGGVADFATGLFGLGEANRAAKRANTAMANSRNTASVVRDRGIDRLNPFASNGTQANSFISALMGFGAPQQGAEFNAVAYLNANPDVKASVMQQMQKGRFNSVEDGARYHFENFGQLEGRDPTGGIASTATPVTRDSVENAFQESFFNAPVNNSIREGLNTSLAASSLRRSGASGRAAAELEAEQAGQNRSNFFNALLGQQGLGYSAINNQNTIDTGSAMTLANLAQQGAANQNAYRQQGFNSAVGGVKGLFGAGAQIAGTVQENKRFADLIGALG